jgi:hypothetical protein
MGPGYTLALLGDLVCPKCGHRNHTTRFMSATGRLENDDVERESGSGGRQQDHDALDDAIYEEL